MLMLAVAVLLCPDILSFQLTLVPLVELCGGALNALQCRVVKPSWLCESNKGEALIMKGLKSLELDNLIS